MCTLTDPEVRDKLSDLAFTLVEGVVAERSDLPAPENSDYPDCRFVCRFTGNGILAGTPCPREISLAVDGFMDYKLCRDAELKAGDKIRCLIVPFEQLDERLKSVQQIDDLNLFELKSYYACGLDVISDFSPTLGSLDFVKDSPYRSVFELQVNPPIPAELARARDEAIDAELKKLEAIMESYSDRETLAALEREFQEKWAAEYAKDPPGRNRVKGTSAWRNINGSFWVLAKTYRLRTSYPPIRREHVEALAALRDFLEANGCQLIVVPIPYCPEIAARVINPDFRHVPDFESLFVVKQLLQERIEAVYISDILMDDFDRYPFAFMYPNHHPSDTVQDIISDLLAERLARYGLPQTLDGEKFSIEWTPAGNTYGTPEFSADCDIGENAPGAPYLCRTVLYDGKRVPPAPPQSSPVLLMSNSYIMSPNGNPFGALSPLLTMKLRLPVYFMYRSSLGVINTAFRELFIEPEKILNGKKVVILVMGNQLFYNEKAMFYNIRDVDRTMRLLNGRSPVKKLPLIAPSGTLSTDGAGMAVLDEGGTYSVPAGGAVKIVEVREPTWDVGKPAVVVITAEKPAADHVRCVVNGVQLNLPSTDAQIGHVGWSRTAYELPSGTAALKIELADEGGRGGTAVVRGVQIFQ